MFLFGRFTLFSLIEPAKDTVYVSFCLPTQPSFCFSIIYLDIEHLLNLNPPVWEQVLLWRVPSYTAVLRDRGIQRFMVKHAYIVTLYFESEMLWFECMVIRYWHYLCVVGEGDTLEPIVDRT